MWRQRTHFTNTLALWFLATTIALASVHPGFEPGYAISCITITGHTGHPERQAYANRQMWG